jgi:hypothetical protein
MKRGPERRRLYKAFDSQRFSAKKRGIKFLLTFNEWLIIWQASGKLPERGRKKGQYVMARFGDKGPYTIDNIKIILCQKNTSEGNKGKKVTFSVEHRANLSAAKKGKPPRPGPVLASTRAKMRAHRLGKPLSSTTRLRISLAAQRRYGRVQCC